MSLSLNALSKSLAPASVPPRTEASLQSLSKVDKDFEIDESSQDYYSYIYLVLQKLKEQNLLNEKYELVEVPKGPLPSSDPSSIAALTSTSFTCGSTTLLYKDMWKPEWCQAIYLVESGVGM